MVGTYSHLPQDHDSLLSKATKAGVSKADIGSGKVLRTGFEPVSHSLRGWWVRPLNPSEAGRGICFTSRIEALIYSRGLLPLACATFLGGCKGTGDRIRTCKWRLRTPLSVRSLTTSMKQVPISIGVTLGYPVRPMPLRFTLRATARYSHGESNPGFLVENQTS